jgi:hypothetical protein
LSRFNTHALLVTALRRWCCVVRRYSQDQITFNAGAKSKQSNVDHSHSIVNELIVLDSVERCCISLDDGYSVGKRRYRHFYRQRKLAFRETFDEQSPGARRKRGQSSAKLGGYKFCQPIKRIARVSRAQKFGITSEYAVNF